MSHTEPPRPAVVIGTGAMGPEIAAALLEHGIPTWIAGRHPDRLSAAVARTATLSGGSAPTGCLVDDAPYGRAALVVETISEDLAAKHDLLSRVEPMCAPDTVIATNTSSLRIGDIATALTHPERFGGLHFLKPAHLTGVVEVIPGPHTDAPTLSALQQTARRLGKTPLTVRADVPGFIWNRVQFAVLRECLHMLEEGVASAADIDAAVSDGLAPRWVAAGPLATADLGGLRTFATICGQLFPHLAAGTEVPGVMARHAQAGTPFAPWTGGDAAAAVAELRAQALAQGRALAARRRELGG